MESAAELGDKKAYSSLTNGFHKEYYTPLEVKDFYLRLSEAGIRDAQRELAAIFNKGYPGSPGISINYAEAYFWLLLAHRGEKIENSKIITQIDGVLSESEKKAVEKRVAEWRPTSLVSGNSEGR